MINKSLTIIIILLFKFAAISQITDYSKVSFSSNIYKYSNSIPRTAELGISKLVLGDIINLLSNSKYSKKQKKEIINKVWLSFSNPKKFDFIYKDFALNTINNWSYKDKKGAWVLEPNPYLTEWTIDDNEFHYFQLALGKILQYFSLIGYGDDAEGVKSSFNKLLITQQIKIHDPNDDDWAYSYLKTLNIDLKEKGLIALISKGDYDIIVCKLDKKDQITKLFKKIQWEFIQP
jgi:hypothetical protein